jgi:hypothetical protein
VVVLLKYLAVLSLLLLSACGGEGGSESGNGPSAGKDPIEYRLTYCGTGFIMKLIPNDSGGYDFVQEIEWKEVSNEAEFAAIAGRTSPHGMCGYYRLTDNITISSYKPLGYGLLWFGSSLPTFAPVGEPFAGVLDGDNHTITIPYGSTLFGTLDNAEIKNLNIETSEADNFTPQTHFYGTLALYARESKINNVHVKLETLALATKAAENNYIGGVIGALESSSIKSSSFTADSADIQDNSSENLYFGGFSGLILGKSVIDNSFVVFKGEAAARNKHGNLYSGGFAGKVAGLDNFNRAFIKDSYVKFDNKSDETDNSSAIYSGGIAGAAELTDFLGARFNAQNLAVNISYVGYVGGIAGYIDDSGVKESNAHADITMRTAAAPPTLSGYIGGTAGWLDNGNVENSYFIGSFKSFETASLNTIHAGVIAGGTAGAIFNSVIDKTGFFSERGLSTDNLKMYSGGIAGYSMGEGIIKNSFAAGPHIAGDTASSSVHRVFGGDPQRVLLSNNYARSDMRIIDGGGVINPPPYEWVNSSEGVDGGGVSVEELSPAFYIDILKWDFKGIWFWDGSPYPKLLRTQKLPIIK